MTRAIGLNLGAQEGVVAVVRRDPLRLAAIATVAWPPQLWRPAGAPVADREAGRRVLAQARRRLGLPRWSVIAVVVDPTWARGGRAGALLPRSAELLARAGLVQGWVVGPAQAARLWSTKEIDIDPRLARAVGAPEAELAIGAALASLASAQLPGGPETTEMDEWEEGAGPATGWAVQRTGELPDDE